MGVHTAAFHLWYFPKIWQDSPEHIVFHFPVFNLQWTSSGHFTSFSGNIPKSLPSGQSTVTSKIPGPLGFPIQAHCFFCVPPLFHIASAVCVEWTLHLNILLSTAVRVPRRAVLQYYSCLKQLKLLHMIPIFLFQLDYSQPWIFSVPHAKTLRVNLESSLDVFCQWLQVEPFSPAAAHFQRLVLPRAAWGLLYVLFPFQFVQRIVIVQGPIEIILLPG